MASMHKLLFQANRRELKFPGSMPGEILEFENQWYRKTINQVKLGELPYSLRELKAKMAEQIEADKADTPETSRYVSEDMSFEEFKILVQEFAMDGLTEAQIFWPIMPKLSLQAQMPMLRMMIDEFGSGNLARSHTTLYINLLNELSMSTNLDDYIEVSGDDSFAFVNMYYWMTLRAEDPSYFAGALTYFETMIPFFFECYTAATTRLGIKEHHYYSEHIHIDEFHAIEGHRILKFMENDGSLDPGRAWQGVCLGRHLTMAAFNAAVEKSRQALIA